MIPWIDFQQTGFPPVNQALTEPDGLLCAGGDLSITTLTSAYRLGIFPWYNEGEPILWWSPDPRMVLFPEELHIARRLKKSLRKSPCSVSINRCFDQVIRQCAAPRSNCPDTWISDQMYQAYLRLHQAGRAHSVEVWDGQELVGGLYGVLIGQVFFGESMFSRQTNASKIALLALTRWLEPLNCPLIDCQVYSEHLSTLGARLISRELFCDYLKHYTGAGTEFDRLNRTFDQKVPLLLSSDTP